MPGANESSTVLWQSAHVMPTDSRRPSSSTNPFTPTTAFKFSSATVTAGSSRFTSPCRSARTNGFGSIVAGAAALVMLLFAGLVLPHLFWRKTLSPTPGDEPDPVDEELLERVRRGAEAFTGFQLITPDWHEPDLP